MFLLTNNTNVSESVQAKSPATFSYFQKEHALGACMEFQNLSLTKFLISQGSSFMTDFVNTLCINQKPVDSFLCSPFQCFHGFPSQSIRRRHSTLRLDSKIDQFSSFPLRFGSGYNFFLWHLHYESSVISHYGLYVQFPHQKKSSNQKNYKNLLKNSAPINLLKKPAGKVLCKIVSDTQNEIQLRYMNINRRFW